MDLLGPTSFICYRRNFVFANIGNKIKHVASYFHSITLKGKYTDGSIHKKKEKSTTEGMVESEAFQYE